MLMVLLLKSHTHTPLKCWPKIQDFIDLILCISILDIALNCQTILNKSIATLAGTDFDSCALKLHLLFSHAFVETTLKTFINEFPMRLPIKAKQQLILTGIHIQIEIHILTIVMLREIYFGRCLFLQYRLISSQRDDEFGRKVNTQYQQTFNKGSMIQCLLADIPQNC